MKIKKYWIQVLTVCLGFMIFLKILNNFFISDDFVFLEYARNNFRPENSKIYRPLAYILTEVQFYLFGLHPFGYYFTNVAAYILTGVMLINISLKIAELNKIVSNDKYLIGTIVALFFITYPYNNESVAWISGKASLFASMFCMISYNIYLLTNNDKKHFVLLSLFSYFISLFFYESVWI